MGGTPQAHRHTGTPSCSCSCAAVCRWQCGITPGGKTSARTCTRDTHNTRHHHHHHQPAAGRHCQCASEPEPDRRSAKRLLDAVNPVQLSSTGCGGAMKCTCFPFLRRLVESRGTSATKGATDGQERAKRPSWYFQNSIQFIRGMYRPDGPVLLSDCTIHRSWPNMTASSESSSTAPPTSCV